MLDFNKETMRVRRAKCEHQNKDPIVWTCHRVMKWIRDIDLKMFADNLQGKGVNGAVLVMNPNFDPDTMARVLEIPVERHSLHRHLREEMKVLLAASSNQEEREGEVVSSLTPVAVKRFAEGRKPMRRSSKSPLRFRSAEARVHSGPRTSRSPMRAYKSVDITHM
ncbi:kazrin-A-like [Corythoichthys intestinalis]|uniref:kazrin-A-like n=1 Tax=Corythoichthys intestinalis TaxID=161448 RepID=UPI0025A545B1|nr:kazrin-A-like [Corythoichthys intestinalis]